MNDSATDRSARSHARQLLTTLAALAVLAAWSALPAAARPAHVATACRPAGVHSNSLPAPQVDYPIPAVEVSPQGVTVNALVESDGYPTTAFVRFQKGAGATACSSAVRLPTGSGELRVAVRLTGLLPDSTYSFEVGASSAGGTSFGKRESFATAASLTVPDGVRVGPIDLSGATKTKALKLLNGFLAAPLRFTFEGADWSAPRARLGAEIDTAATVAQALKAEPGSHLRLALSIDRQRLRTYLSTLNKRFAHTSRSASIRLVGRRAVVKPAAPSIQVDGEQMSLAVRTALDSGLSERLRLIVKTSKTPHDSPAKAVVVRLGRQTLTAYLNGKPVLTTPITTGRVALPTPVGSYHVIFRASPFVFHSPWPPGSAYWYPPTPVTWAVDFYGGDFLHDDPGEPTGAYGAGSEYGPYASHGCVHVPHSVMAFLYGWLPVGSQVIVAQD